MADNEQDTREEAKEGQEEASQKPAIQVPQEGKDAQAVTPQADDFGPKQGETIEQYANRMRNEVGWRDQQLKRATRQKNEADTKAAKAAEIEAENQRLKALAEAGTKKDKPESAPPPQSPQPASEDLKRQARFEAKVEQLGTELLEKHSDEWRSAHANFERVGGVQPEFLRDVLATDNPSYVMLQLGKNMGEYQRIMDLPEDRRRAALFKLGMEPGQQAPKPEAKKPSGAPPPTANALPPGSAAPAEGDFDLYDPKYAGSDHDKAWYQRRLAEKRNSKGRPWSVGGRSG